MLLERLDLGGQVAQLDTAHGHLQHRRRGPDLHARAVRAHRPGQRLDRSAAQPLQQCYRMVNGLAAGQPVSLVECRVTHPPTQRLLGDTDGLRCGRDRGTRQQRCQSPLLLATQFPAIPCHIKHR
jgi:hypothetical protein